MPAGARLWNVALLLLVAGAATPAMSRLDNPFTRFFDEFNETESAVETIIAAMIFSNSTVAERFAADLAPLRSDLSAGFDGTSQLINNQNLASFSWVLVVFAQANSTLASGSKLELNNQAAATVKMNLNLYYNSTLPEEETSDDASAVVDTMYFFAQNNLFLESYYEEFIVPEYGETQGETLPNRPSDTFMSFSLFGEPITNGTDDGVPPEEVDIPTDAPDPAIGEREPEFSQFDISQQCENAIQTFNEQQRTFGPARRCGNCLDTALSDVPNLNGADAIIEAAEEGLLNSCCYLGCPSLFEDFVETLESECTEANIMGPLEFYRTLRVEMNSACEEVEEIDEACGDNRSNAPGEGRLDVCQIRNDPHLAKFQEGAGFSARLVTCNVTGSDIALLDNKFFRISMDAVPIARQASASFRGASIVQMLKIGYKNSTCGSNETITSDATWRDSRTNTEMTVRSFTMNQGTPDEQDYLTVTLTSPWTEGSGLCVEGCPEDAQNNIEFGSARRARRALLQTEAEQTCGGATINGEDVESTCLDCYNAGVTYEDDLAACIFDAVSTGDATSFAEASAEALNNLETAIEEAEESNNNFLSPSGPSGPGGGPSKAVMPYVTAACMAITMLAAALVIFLH